MRTIGILATAVLGLAACGRKDGGTAPPAGRDATGAAAAPTDAAAAAVDPEEPRTPPPAPTAKPGGKGDCKVEYAPRPTRDPNPMCKIAGGTFTMGSPPDAHPHRADERPQRKVTVSRFRLDQFEVTVAQVAHFLDAAGNACPSKRGSCFYLANDGGDSPIREENGRHLFDPSVANLPMQFAFFEGAERYCAWAGKRLPTEAEWELAARHDPATGKDLLYPWGDRFEKNRAACGEAACADGFPGLAPVGSFDGTGGRGDGTSPWGVHDMAGNAPEPVADCFTETYPDCGDCKDPRVVTDDCAHGQRGGGSSSDALHVTTTERQMSAGPGIRCAMSEP